MASYYQYGLVDPSRPRREVKERPKEPTLYTYIPPQLRQNPPPAPPAQSPAAVPVSFGTYHLPPAAAAQCPAPGFQNGLTQHIFIPHQAAPPVVQQYVSPAPPRPQPVACQGVPWYGPTRAEVHARNIATARATGAMRPQSLVPYKPEDGQQWWCRELDNSYTLRTTNDIMENLQPGKWEYSESGYPYFVRHPAPST